MQFNTYLDNFEGIFIPRIGPYKGAYIRFNLILPPDYPKGKSDPAIQIHTDLAHPFLKEENGNFLYKNIDTTTDKYNIVRTLAAFAAAFDIENLKLDPTRTYPNDNAAKILMEDAERFENLSKGYLEASLNVYKMEVEHAGKKEGEKKKQGTLRTLEFQKLSSEDAQFLLRAIQESRGNYDFPAHANVINL